jgi:hypothetical protein
MATITPAQKTASVGSPQADLLAAAGPAAAATPPPEVAAVPSAQEHIKAGHQLIAKAQSFEVTNAETYAMAIDILQRMRGAYKSLEDERLGITRLIDASK